MVVIIPNSNLFKNKVTVNTAYDKRRISVRIGIGCSVNIVEAKKVILETLAKISGILNDPPTFDLVVNYGGVAQWISLEAIQTLILASRK